MGNRVVTYASQACLDNKLDFIDSPTALGLLQEQGQSRPEELGRAPWLERMAWHRGGTQSAQQVCKKSSEGNKLDSQ
jgi:hypothetical protein